jgi:hypothetical protein
MVRRMFIDETIEHRHPIVANIGEIKREEMMIFGNEAMKDHEPIKMWLFEHIRRLSETTIKDPLVGVDSIAGLIDCGRERTIDVLIPKMDAHISTIDSKAHMVQLADHGDITALYSCFLDTFTLDYLKAFAGSLDLKISQAKTPLITSIAMVSTIDQFNHFIISNELTSKDRCVAMLAAANLSSRPSKQTDKESRKRKK